MTDIEYPEVPESPAEPGQSSDPVVADEATEASEPEPAGDADIPFVQLVEPAPNDEERNQGEVPGNVVNEEADHDDLTNEEVETDHTDRGVLDPDRMSSSKDPHFGLDMHREVWDDTYGRPHAKELYGEDGTDIPNPDDEDKKSKKSKK